MRFVCRKSRIRGEVAAPGSKSHTIRGVVIAGLAEGVSVLRRPLDSEDTRAALRGMTALGAEVDAVPGEGVWRIRGTAGEPCLCADIVDVGNSGTTLRMLMGAGSLAREGEITLTGDAQILRRPMGPLAAALSRLGARVECRGSDGRPPVAVSGLLRGGNTAVDGVTSQFVSSLLLACPLASGGTLLEVPLLNERPYVQMTLDWLAGQGIVVEHEAMALFRIPGGQAYGAFERRIPGDYSSATFFLAAGAMPGNRVTCLALDRCDSQADMAVTDYLRAMGAEVTIGDDRVTVEARELRGVELDLNATPDALPAMAVLGCFARGRTSLRNVAHARIKETDRISVMTRELTSMGADVRELPDGMVIEHSRLRGAEVDGHGDHRVVMALALAGLSAPGTTAVNTAEAAAVTFPGFADSMTGLGARLAGA